MQGVWRGVSVWDGAARSHTASTSSPPPMANVEQAAATGELCRLSAQRVSSPQRPSPSFSFVLIDFTQRNQYHPNLIHSYLGFYFTLNATPNQPQYHCPATRKAMAHLHRVCEAGR
jgi:hypothetical protein